MRLPWAISIDAADKTYSPISNSQDLLSLRFGVFDDSFMHKGHERTATDGYNEQCWQTLGYSSRWQSNVCGGKISYYKDDDQSKFLNPRGMYGVTWEQMAAKYHLSFMIANDAPGTKYATVSRFLQAGMATGYQFHIIDCRTSDKKTQIIITNRGVAPLYYDAYMAITDSTQKTSSLSSQSLKGLLPGQSMKVIIDFPLTCPEALHIICPHLLPTQSIEFFAE